MVNSKRKGDSLGRLTYCSYLGSSTVDYAITDLDQSQQFHSDDTATVIRPQTHSPQSEQVSESSAIFREVG